MRNMLQPARWGLSALVYWTTMRIYTTPQVIIYRARLCSEAQGLFCEKKKNERKGLIMKALLKKRTKKQKAVRHI